MFLLACLEVWNINPGDENVISISLVHMQMQTPLGLVSHDHKILPLDAEHKLESVRPKLQSESNEYVL